MSARQRWQILGNAIRRQRLSVESLAVSVRRFGSMGLLTTRTVPADGTCKEPYLWREYECAERESSQPGGPFHALHLRVRHLPTDVSLEAMMGFNNTGNVCVWVSEEVMTYYCLQRAAEFKGKRVCELGAGMSGLCSLAIAQQGAPDYVLATDGNAEAVENLRVCVAANERSFPAATRVCARVLLWDRSDQLAGLANTFDVVLCADGLFFTQSHVDLLVTIDRLLVPGGQALLFAPRRGPTLEAFRQLAERMFASVTVEEQYDSYIWQHHEEALASNPDYSPDIHKPLLTTLHKK